MYRDATSSSSDEDDLLFAADAALLFGLDAEPIRGPIQKVPCRTSALSGRQWFEELMSGHYTRIMDATRLSVDSFMRLCNILADCGFVPQHHQKRVTIEEALAMTLVMMSHNMRMRMIVDRFNHSLEIVHRNIHEVIKGLCTFAQFIITPRRQDEVHPKIFNATRFYLWFEDAVRTIDGTHIPASVPSRRQVAYTNRYGVQSVVCDHDMRFVYVYAGWEGSAHDAQRTFGVLKRRFAILRGAIPHYMMTAQINVVIVCCAVHNFIRDQQPNDYYFANPDIGDPDTNGAIPPYPEIHPLHSPPEVINQWIGMRDAMANHMFSTYRNTRHR
nr:uncharacterized protein LOC113709807 [Coffea arabica]